MRCFVMPLSYANLVYEGTLYALLMSTLNVGGVTSENLGGLLTWALGVSSHNFKNLWLLVLICNLTSLLPLPLLYYWVPSDEELAQGMAEADAEPALTVEEPNVLFDQDIHSESDSDASTGYGHALGADSSGGLERRRAGGSSSGTVT